MAEIIRYVDTASDGDGDGTTAALTGANCAYASLSAWEAAEETTLDGNWMHVYVAASAGAADILSCTITGWTQVDSDDKIVIEASPGQGAIASGWKTDRYRMEVADNSCIYINEDFVQIRGLQLKGTWSSADVYGIRVGTALNTSVIHIDSCRIWIVGDVDGNQRGISGGDGTDTTLYIYNTIVENTGGADGNVIGIRPNAAAGYIYNCCVRGFYYGIRNDATLIVKNTASFDNDDDFYGTITVDFCASDDGDGTNDVAESGGGAGWPNDFEGAATGDFRLKSGSGLVGHGVDNPGTGLYSDDIDGTARTSTWDVGAYEYVSGGGSIVPIIMNEIRRRL